jgi:hypothetical protein
MSTGTDQWSPKSAAANAETVERPSWMAQRAAAESTVEEAATAPAAPEAASALYCDQCWAPLSISFEECPDCGRILVEMRAEQARQASEDRRWRPPRAGKPAYRTPEMRKKKTKRVAQSESNDVAVPESVHKSASFDAMRAFEQARPILTVVVVGLLLGGVAVFSFWFSIATYR